MKIKICGLFRKEDIAYINEARPDYAGFVFAESRRQVFPAEAASLRDGLAPGIVPVGVFVDAPIAEIAALYRDGVIEIAQLHGSEDGEYITLLKQECAIPVIKTIIHQPSGPFAGGQFPLADYYLLDSGAGSGKTFNWDLIDPGAMDKPWFLAGGIGIENIKEAMALKPYGIDLSSAAETNGIKDRKKILQLTERIKNE